MKKLIYEFAETPGPTLPEVGGKGLSLIKMSQSGMAIPPGFVLTVAFFEPWLEVLRGDAIWGSLGAQPSDAELKAWCDGLKQRCESLALTPGQRDAITGPLHRFPKDALFAVRSSSPEEDLEGSSFAGGYETVLGVSHATLEQAIRRAFASCLDVRVAIYKRENRFDWRSPRIAVVVQQLVQMSERRGGVVLGPGADVGVETAQRALHALGTGGAHAAVVEAEHQPALRRHPAGEGRVVALLDTHRRSDQQAGLGGGRVTVEVTLEREAVVRLETDHLDLQSPKTLSPALSRKRARESRPAHVRARARG